ncbi:hypothetical protein BB561_000936 [Smittium simulii]|uniref:Extracellular membrane protein CFEM domain-containing protein n=1 Tax=Smittium simulii TaxID=133385 RepID=A0A2T9YWW3_9FUNG|nr:hypothetical protein BB561_000936 [Smittium simulii]
MKLLTIYTIASTFFFQAFSQGLLSTYPGKEKLIQEIRDELCYPNIKCSPGYLGVDCTILNNKMVDVIGCFLKGKTGKSGKGVSLMGDSENTGKFCNKKAYENHINNVCKKSVAPIQATGVLRESSPRIVDIQKCISKCVDDVLR